MTAAFVWITPRAALTMLDQKKLAALTNEKGQAELIGVGDGTTTDFWTPFVFGSDLRAYGDNIVLGGYTMTVDDTRGERIKVHFAVAPALGVRLSASSTDSVNADNFDAAMLRAQGLVRGMLDAQLYAIPSDATAIPDLVTGWAAAIAWYLLATDPRRPRLIEAYPELLRRYDDVYGNVDSDLKRVAKGNFSLRGLLQTIDPSTPDTVKTGFTSNPVVYTASGYRGVQ